MTRAMAACQNDCFWRVVLSVTQERSCLWTRNVYPRRMLKTEKPPADLELKRRIQDLIDYKGGGFNQESVADIIENALKLLADVKDSGDVRVIQTAVRELRYAFRLFAPYSASRKVTIFGSARTQPTRMEYQQGVEFGRKIAEAGFMVITGAGGGIMQAGHEGAGPEM